MISRILDFSVHQRWLVVLISLLAAGFRRVLADQASYRRCARYY